MAIVTVSNTKNIIKTSLFILTVLDTNFVDSIHRKVGTTKTIQYLT